MIQYIMSIQDNYVMSSDIASGHNRIKKEHRDLYRRITGPKQECYG